MNNWAQSDVKNDIIRHYDRQGGLGLFYSSVITSGGISYSKTNVKCSVRSNEDNTGLVNEKMYEMLILKAVSKIIPDNILCFTYFQRNKKIHLADDSHEMSCLIFSDYKIKIQTLSSAVVINTLWVKHLKTTVKAKLKISHFFYGKIQQMIN